MPPRITDPTFAGELRRRFLRTYPFDALLPNGVVSAGGTSVVTAPVVALDTGASTGTARMREMVENAQTSLAFRRGSETLWGVPWRVSAVCIVNGVLSADGTGYVGIELGSYGVAAIPTGVHAQNVLQLVWHDNGGGLTTIQLRVQRGDSATATTVLDVVTGSNPLARANRFELEYMPFEYVIAFVNGLEVGRVTNPSLLPVPTNNQVRGFGCLVSCGPTIADQSAAYFHTGSAETYAGF